MEDNWTVLDTDDVQKNEAEFGGFVMLPLEPSPSPHFASSRSPLKPSSKSPSSKRARSLSSAGQSPPAVTLPPFVNKGFLDDEKYRRMQQLEGPSVAKLLEQSASWKGLKIPDDPIKAKLKLKFLIRKGVPDYLRAMTWSAVTGTTYWLRTFSNSHEGIYKEKLEEVFGPRIPEKIAKPPLFGGSFKMESFFLKPDADIVARRLLCVIGMDCPDIKYSPLIPDVILMLLHFLPEADAYFVILMMLEESKKSHKYFHLSNVDFNLFVLTFKSIIKKCFPRIYTHMQKKLKLDVKTLSEEWFKRMFIDDLPFRTILRIFDAYLNEGSRVLYRIGLGMLATKEASLLATKDANTFVNIIKQSASQLFDDDPFMKASFKISLHPDKVDKYRNKNRSSVKIDSDHVPHHVYYRPKIKEPSKIVDEEVFEILYEWIPMRYRITDPVLLFSSNTDGYSFKTLFKKVEDQEPTLLFIKTADGNAFGAYISSKWKQGVFGTREMFLFKLIPQLKRYSWVDSGIDSFVTLEPASLSIGVGNGIGLYIDEEWFGSSSQCDTFKNDALNGENSDKFECVHVEVFGFS